MLMSLAELRTRGLAHRDIKVENILVYRDRNQWSFVLGDLGALCTRDMGDLYCGFDSHNRTTITSLPPILRTRSKSVSVDPVLNGYLDSGVDDTGYRSIDDMFWADIYAIGCVIYQFLTGRIICQGRLQDIRPMMLPNISYIDDMGIRHTIDGVLLGNMLEKMLYSASYREATEYEQIDIYKRPVKVGEPSIWRTIGKTLQRTARYRMKKPSRRKNK